MCYKTKVDVKGRQVLEFRFCKRLFVDLSRYGNDGILSRLKIAVGG